jgi:hypothetical protein
MPHLVSAGRVHGGHVAAFPRALHSTYPFLPFASPSRPERRSFSMPESDFPGLWSTDHAPLKATALSPAARKDSPIFPSPGEIPRHWAPTFWLHRYSGITIRSQFAKISLQWSESPTDFKLRGSRGHDPDEVLPYLADLSASSALIYRLSSSREAPDLAGSWFWSQHLLPKWRCWNSRLRVGHRCLKRIGDSLHINKVSKLTELRLNGWQGELWERVRSRKKKRNSCSKIWNLQTR